ncbi:serine/arginine repetitive matrix protein 1-like [Solea solea]|uniref:serine/arginine repetitive matrix protein 1-like n=1 Tax=Solea solea TaxID=90069 RepID=UPI00272B6692|nr:serine/arginine repetitive matrix protein 1-like [Solea solea]
MTAFLYQKSPAVVDDVAIKERQFLSYQKSVFTDKAPAANKENKLSWGSRLFGQNKENHEKQKQSILTSAHKKTHETKEQKKLSWWKRFKNRSQVSSAPREQREPEKKRISNTQRHTREAQDEGKATAGAANRRENTSRCKRLFRLGVEKEKTPRNEKQSFTIPTNPNKKMPEKPIRCLRSEVIPTTLELLIPERRCRSTFAKQTTVEVKGTEPVPPINPPKKIIRMPDGSTVRYTLATIPEEQQNAGKRPSAPPQHTTVEAQDTVQVSPTKSPRKKQIRFLDVSTGGSRIAADTEKLQRCPSPHPRHKKVEFKDTGQVSPIESPKSRQFESLGFSNPAATIYISPGPKDFVREESLEVELAYRHLQATLKRCCRHKQL